MIKAIATGANGRKIAILGITDGNIQRLREGKPIHIHGEEMGLGAIEIWIVTGKDEAALQEVLSPLIGPETRVRDHRDVPKQ